ncbi:Glutaredoxin-1 [Candidatus Terasakiella magnetica]|uniref:Glutaredoxin-1 n=1 Tax=Candidatus Terasakiella magnetica TaxID=1867952 RepID=A0A1C3RMG5_9PROT|nr:glutaredoxin domain-containing protein [Candidatus Terasakiella magnetica]SCA58299.1 Glutaredoxin-1 [Candidatus Terasakiella magnetica]
MAVEIYTKESCIFCQKAKALFQDYNVPYIEYDVSTVAKFKDMQERITAAKTVPQIIIDDHLIGGFDVLDAHKEAIFTKLKKTQSSLSA